ncbi:outer membrane protein assembly factor BamE [Sedimentitalea todarodis]|uniref:Outer membrane protein assembly factor BamE n=1 Tax=Sedimentitalea todarodis TaxID=1631240 RepID=A0ABU3VCA7_9RHOB|nr:outer membrane protein assembly factor BamE [Sedimentitalea todarodis]MDU9003807.1 outer membrane protein assembly factor BamE [Sedimentitalea todarodis]
MIGTASRIRPALRTAVILAVGLAIAGCTAIYRNHGYVPTEEDLAKVTVGVDTRDTVAEAVGVPSVSGVLNDSGYYYVSSRLRHYGALQPKVVERQLVAISFSQSGVVQNIERFGLEDGRVIALNRRVTESSVNDKTLLRQLLGNIGNLGPGSVVSE